MTPRIPRNIAPAIERFRALFASVQVRPHPAKPVARWGDAP
jgi:hypothetical protein